MITTSPRHRRRTLWWTAALAVVLAAPACGKDVPGNAAPATTAPTGTGTTVLGGDLRAPSADQASPSGANGMAFRDGLLWVADLTGRQIVVVDPATGTILSRFGKEAGVDAQPDDLTVAPDGDVWWTGFDTGVVGRIGASGRSDDVATLRPGANAITTGPDGHLYVTAAVTGDGFWTIDPGAPDAGAREIAPALGNVNGFAFGPDGALYGPAYAEQKSTVVRIDLATGATTPVAEGFRFGASVRFGPDGRAYVLSAIQPEVHVVDLATGESAHFATPSTPVVDNMAWGPDGNLYVSAMNKPEITVIGPDGAVLRTLTLGRPAP